MNCTEDEYMTCWNGGTLREEPTQEVIDNFAERNGLDVNVATNYFGHKCKECNKKIKDKEVIGMNMKFAGRNISDMYCKKHLKEKLQLDEEQWNYFIEMFKQQGCDLI